MSFVCVRALPGTVALFIFLHNTKDDTHNHICTYLHVFTALVSVGLLPTGAVTNL